MGMDPVIYQETRLPFGESGYQKKRDPALDRLHEMKRLFVYGRESVESKAKNFVRQAVFMEDFEDDFPWKGEFVCFFPTYQDMTLRQLRGYFSWRTNVRKGKYLPIPASAAYLYIYELLNGVGAESAEDALCKMREFENGYLNADVGSGSMRKNLHRWMFEFGVVKGVSREVIRQAADPDMLSRDENLRILRNPDSFSDGEVFDALCFFGGKNLAKSPVLERDSERGKRLFREIWTLASSYREDDKDLFTLCFGKRIVRPWSPLANALYYRKIDSLTMGEDFDSREYRLNDCRTYYREGGSWYVKAYEKLYFDRERFRAVLHEADAKLRRYLKTGRYLKEKPEDGWILPYIEAVIRKDQAAELEAAKPKVTIDFSSLEKIRRDAGKTRDSLLTEEELAEETVPRAEAVAGDAVPRAEAAAGDAVSRADAVKPESEEVRKSSETEVFAKTDTSFPEIPLDPLRIRIIRTLLAGGDVSGILRENYLMPSLVADEINEGLFDEIGDIVLLCEDDRLVLVEDYKEDLEALTREHE